MPEKIGMKSSRIKLYTKICERAEAAGYIRGMQIDAMMDVESADRTFNLDLESWLNSNDLDFAHDFCGIRDNIVRDDFPAMNFNGFIPRFTGKGE